MTANCEVYITNFLAVILLLLMSYTIRRKLFLPKYELKDIFSLFDCTLLSCVVEPFLFFCDSKSEDVPRFVILILNSYQYLAYLSISYLWFMFVFKHMFGNIKRKYKSLIAIPLYIGALLLLINLFKPLIFELDVHNKYHRLFGYYIMFDLNIIYMASSFVVYLYARKKNGGLSLLPIWAILLPVFLGTILGSFFPNVSVILALVAIALTGVISSLQNETIYRDHLTRIFNRAYIDVLVHRFKHKKVIGIMFDINDFKSINDTYGHKEGDKALLTFANALNCSNFTKCTCLRYAGDEFLVFINSTNFKEVSKFISLLDENLNISKRDLKLPYDLTYCYGYSLFDSDDIDFDTFMNIIDGKMYEFKRQYHNI